jgi:hypothetical protein
VRLLLWVSRVSTALMLCRTSTIGPKKANKRRMPKTGHVTKNPVTSENLACKLFRFRDNSKSDHSFTRSQVHKGGGGCRVVRTGDMVDILNRGHG